MEFTLYEEDDAMLITLRHGPSYATKQLDENRYVGVDDTGDLVWISILNITEGVGLDMLTGPDLDQARRLTEQHNIRVLQV